MIVRLRGSKAEGLVLRYITAVVKSFQLIVSSIRLWPLCFWIKFWMLNGDELEIPIESMRFVVRTRGLHRKLTDLYMITSCTISAQYTPDPFFQIRQSDSIIDIGAHIGAFSVYAALRSERGRVFCYEPDESNCRQLEKNIQINNLKNVRISREAVAGARGLRAFYSTKFNNAESNLYWGGPSARQVPCVTLADIFSNNGIDHCDFLKIDCEGAEYEILRATPPRILCKIAKISVESHVGRYFGIPDESAEPDALVGFLRQAGYSVHFRKENSLHTIIFARRE